MTPYMYEPVIAVVCLAIYTVAIPAEGLLLAVDYYYYYYYPIYVLEHKIL